MTPATTNANGTSAAVSPDPKIIDILRSKKPEDDDDDNNKPFVSLEYFPPRSEEGVTNLYSRMDRMKATLQPAFTDVTWGAGGSTADLSMQIALQAHRTGHVANLHMTCTNLSSNNNDNSVDPKLAILQALRQAHAGGIRNLVALRGDPPAGQDEFVAANGGFSCALDLVKFIHQHAAAEGFDFGIAVAGYPEGHPTAISKVDDVSKLTSAELARSSTPDDGTTVYTCLDADYQKEMAYLKEKIDAGSDLIITQMFFDVHVFHQFVHDCRAIGITCPIIPGIMCINNYAGFAKMTKFCKTRVPHDLAQKMDGLKTADAATVKQFGIDFGAQLCRDILDPKYHDSVHPNIPVLHFYTLNLEKVVYGVLEQLGGWSCLTDKANEADAATMAAIGSAWARVGDIVTTPYGVGAVSTLNEKTGQAKITLTAWTMAAGQSPTAILQKGQYQKQF